MPDMQSLVRENIRALTPYSSARDEFKGSQGIFLDANENPYNKPYNRYPDPLQWKLKHKISTIKGIAPERIFLGNGSDEAIDLLIRAFCEPGRDNIVSIDPSYGMYQVAANINNVEFRKAGLNPDFTLNIQNIEKLVDENTKLIMLCSPNNPTSNSFSPAEMISLASGFNGLLVIDEAYIDFSSQPTLLEKIDSVNNLVILQTFSKAWGMAGLRLGLAFANEKIIGVLNKIKYPYNINAMTQKIVVEALDDTSRKARWVKKVLRQRNKLSSHLGKLKIVETIYPSDANFLLVKVNDPQSIYHYLIDKKIIIRDRSRVSLCSGCIRITIGKKKENKALFEALKEYEKNN